LLGRYKRVLPTSLFLFSKDLFSKLAEKAQGLGGFNRIVKNLTYAQNPT